MEKLRSFKINGFAVFDIVATVLVAYALDEKVLHVNNKKRYYASLVPISVMAHKIVGQDTFFVKQLARSFVYKLFLYVSILITFFG